MGLFNKIFKKKITETPTKTEISNQSIPEPEQVVEQSVSFEKKRDSWLDELTDPNSGVHDALSKLAKVPNIQEKPQKAEDAYTFEQNDSTFYIYKNGKEFFDGDLLIKNGQYILAEGWRGGNQALALFTLDTLLTTRKFEDTAEGVALLTSGVAFVFTDNDKVIIMSKEGNSTKVFAYGSALDEARVITDSACAYVEDYGEYALLKCFVFSTQTVWSKKIKYKMDDDSDYYSDEPVLRCSGGVLELTTPDGEGSHFSFGGDIV